MPETPRPLIVRSIPLNLIRLPIRSYVLFLNKRVLEFLGVWEFWLKEFRVKQSRA